MIRRIIKIDESKCNGCGLCAEACHEGAIEILEGKARLTREDYCDGLGDCLPPYYLCGERQVLPHRHTQSGTAGLCYPRIDRSGALDGA